MSNSLENIVQSESLTLKQELAQSIKQYPKTLKEYAKMLVPATIVSCIGSALGQWGAESLGYTSSFATTAAAYVCGYIPGYVTFFEQEYRRNKQKYPSRFSKEFGEFVGTFMAADYVSDLTTFTPTFIATNLWIKSNTAFHPALRSVIAWNTGAVLYILSIAALHPVTRRINQAINIKIKSVYNAILSQTH